MGQSAGGCREERKGAVALSHPRASATSATSATCTAIPAGYSSLRTQGTGEQMPHLIQAPRPRRTLAGLWPEAHLGQGCAGTALARRPFEILHRRCPGAQVASETADAAGKHALRGHCCEQAGWAWGGGAALAGGGGPA